jgi:hypothetical protein
MEDLDFEDADSLLQPDEIERREALLASAEDEDTKESIRGLFFRIAAEREEKRAEWEEKLRGTASADAQPVEDAKGAKYKVKPEYRQGWEDKRMAGDAPPSPPPPETAAGDEGGEAAAGGDAGSAAPARDPLSELASVAVFNVDPSKLTPEQFDAAFGAHCKERAGVEWEALQEVKDDAVLGALWLDAEALLKQEGLPMSAEGLEKLYLLEKVDQKKQAQLVFDGSRRESASSPQQNISAPSAAASDSHWRKGGGREGREGRREDFGGGGGSREWGGGSRGPFGQRDNRGAGGSSRGGGRGGPGQGGRRD